MAADTRRRMVEAASELIRTRGLHEASFTEVLSASGAARGAIYHHFPGGKGQLAAEAVRLTQRNFTEAMRAAPGDSPRAVLDAFLGMVRYIISSPGGPGCSVGAVVQDGASDDLRET